jgi:hypothetical protein
MTDYSQPGIFNALDYGMSPANYGTANAIALQDAINAAQQSGNPNGAIVLIPSFDGASPPNYGPYDIAVPIVTPLTAISISDTGYPCPLLICGTGMGTTLLMQTDNATLFDVSNNPWVTFQDLTIQYDIVEGVGGLGVAFSFSSSSSAPSPNPGANLFRVNILNCEQAVIFDQITQGSMLQCTVSYNGSYPNQDCTAVQVINSSEVTIEQCLFFFDGATNTSTTVGLNIGESTASRVVSTQISKFDTGIVLATTGGFSGTTVMSPTFTSLQIDALTSCVSISSMVYGATFVNCHFQPTNSSPGGSGIVLSAADNGEIDTVAFTSCTVNGYTSGYYGLEIVAGQNIQVNGGSYSGNGTAGIAITGAASEIQINGANCIGPSYAGSSISTTQQYGIYITAGQDIQITGVTCSGNGTSLSSGGAGIYVAGDAESPVQDIRIVGAACTGSALGGAAEQQYGIYIVGASGVVVDGCDLMGNTAYAAVLESATYITVNACELYSDVIGAKGVFLEGTLMSPTEYIFIRNCDGAQYATSLSFQYVVEIGTGVLNVEVTNCAGYNDQHWQLTTSAPSGTFSGITVDSYYGPTVFYLEATGAAVYIDGTNTHLSQGGFTLAPGETAQISGGTVTKFLMLGR